MMNQVKLFIGGISRDTSEDTLKDHFERYGSVSDSVVVKNGSTKNPRGFGFVWFADQSSADKALNDGHVILGRTVSFALTLLLHYFFRLCLVAGQYGAARSKDRILSFDIFLLADCYLL